MERDIRRKVEVRFMKIPDYSEEEIKEIEKEFDKEEGWADADEVFGEREVESFFRGDKR